MIPDYIDSKHFGEVIEQYNAAQAEGRDTTELGNKLAEIVSLLADNLIETFKFRIDKDDARQEALCHCFATFRKFRPEKGKAFNYFTSCVLNHWRQVYRTHKNYIELKRRFLAHQAEQAEGVRMEYVDGKLRLTFHDRQH